MPYKNLLVHLDDTSACAGRVEAAVALAAAHEAHLTGLYVRIDPGLPGFVAAEIPRDIVTAEQERVRAAARDAGEAFQAACEAGGVTGESRTETGLAREVDGIIALHARYADLAIVGQAPPDEDPAGGPGMIEHLVLSSGRPVLIVPYIGAPESLGRCITIAWDSGREAARAVADAMPLLERAEAVHVLAVNPRSGISGHSEEPGSDIALHLARHGVKAEVNHAFGRDVEVGDLLLSWLADSASDLLVMGAYGHARLRQLVFGGVTRRIFESMTVPVLMSH